MWCNISLFSFCFVNSVLSQISDKNTNDTNNQIESTFSDDYIRQPVPSSKDDLRNQDTREIFRMLADQSNNELQQQQQQSNSYNVVEDKFYEYRNLSLVTSPARPLSTPRDPYADPNRYNRPQIRDNQEFVNGQRYGQSSNYKDNFGRRIDTRLQSQPGVYDRNNDPKFSNIENTDFRNIPKYDANLQANKRDRYDSSYRYYERFPERRRDQLRDPLFDPRWDNKNGPKAPGVLGGWLPDIQGACRPGCENLDRSVTVTTGDGNITGFYVYLYDGPGVPFDARTGYGYIDKVKSKVSVFLGIPYAQPPVGQARLMPPRPLRGWQSIDAVDWRSVCPQPLEFVGGSNNAPTMDEDCLYLNVFTPTVESMESQLFPVMIYIHGGEFQKGSANTFLGHQLAANGKVVVVTINYRLGALGFFSTGDEHAPGNYGLLDMAMAIKWVYNNVYAFQGDAKKITLFGPDAGAASAGILAVMPKTREMVRRVIAISGSPIADWAVFNDKFQAMNTSLVFGKKIGCTIEDSSKLVDCIRKRDFRELTVPIKPEIGTWPWAPIVQKNISMPENTSDVEWSTEDFVALPELVSVMYENEEYHPDLQYLTGVAKDDASYMLYNNKSLQRNSYEVGWPFFDIMVKDHIKQHNYTRNPEEIFNAIKSMYTYYPDPDNKSHIREELINLWSDYLFTAPQDAIVKTLVKNGVDTYMYVQNTTVEALKLPWWRRISHNLEYFFLTGAPFMDIAYYPADKQISRESWTEGDRNMSEFFIYAMANFSWYGNPTPKNILGVHWDMVVPGEIQKYLAINTTENSTTLWNYRQKECAFWTEYLPTVLGKLQNKL